MFTLLCSLLGLLVGSFVIAMSLFGSLPPPTAKRAAEEAAAEEQEPEVKRLRASGGQGPGSLDIHGSSVANGVSQPLPLLLLPAADSQQAPQPPPAEQQQQQEEGEQAAAETGEQPPGAAGPPPPTSGGQDQVAAALRKIASHIAHPKKFPKASELLRQLFGQGALRAEHGPLAFSALKAAMRDPQRAHDPQLAREYSKLFTVASKHAEVRHHTTCPCSLLYLFGGGWVGGRVAQWFKRYRIAGGQRRPAKRGLWLWHCWLATPSPRPPSGGNRPWLGVPPFQLRVPVISSVGHRTPA